MKLKVTDQIHVSFIQADSLRPGQVIEVTDEQGANLLKAHPGTFKAAVADENKMEAAPANKAAGKQKAK